MTAETRAIFDTIREALLRGDQTSSEVWTLMSATRSCDAGQSGPDKGHLREVLFPGVDLGTVAVSHNYGKTPQEHYRAHMDAALSIL